MTNAGTGAIKLYGGWDGGSTVAPAVTPGTGAVQLNAQVSTRGDGASDRR